MLLATSNLGYSPYALGQPHWKYLMKAEAEYSILTWYINAASYRVKFLMISNF